MKRIRVLAVIPGSESDQGFIFARRQIRHLQDSGADVVTFFLQTRTHPAELLHEARRFRKFARSVQPDIVHAHYGTMTALFCVAFSAYPVIVTLRGSDLNPSSEFSYIRALISRMMSQVAALFAREVVCVSDELRRRLWRRTRVEVIPDGVDLAEFVPMPQDEARARLGWSPSERVVLFNQGMKLLPNKRRDLVEAAMVHVRAQIPAARLVVLDGNVKGAEVPVYINASDAVAMASDYEGSPNIVKEALACNVPVCSVRVGDVPEMLEGVSGCVLVDRTPEAMAKGLIELLSKPRRTNGRAFAYRFSLSMTTQRMLRIIERAAR